MIVRRSHIPAWAAPAAIVCAVLSSLLFPQSCANTTEAPTGGARDTIPPVIVGIKPLPGASGVPTHKTQIVFSFNEFVKVKEPKNIYLSPPQEKAPKYKIKGKNVIVYFEEDLKPNTTYTLDISSAIVDNNEGNVYPGFTLVFSTGTAVDSMLVTGAVLDSKTLNPVKGATVMLYKDASDSAVFKHRPDASTKTDDWGYFALRNVQDTVYRLYAIVDESGNNIFDPDVDQIAFASEPVRPTTVVKETMPEVLKYDMKDTVNIRKRRQEHELTVFRSKTAKQMIKDKVRTSDRSAYVTFMAPGAKVDSVWVEGLDKARLMTQFNIERDSLEIWFNDQRRMPDTVKLQVKYMKSDSLGKLVSVVEECRLVDANKKPVTRSSRRNIKHQDTICVITPTAASETVEQYGVALEFKYPLVKASFDSLKLRIVNPRQRESFGKFSVTRDPWNLRSYTVRPADKLLPGYEYFIKIPHRVFMDVNGYWNDSTEVKFSLPTDDKLSTLVLDVSGVSNKYIVDLLSEKKDKVIRSFTIESDEILKFPYVTAGKYCIRFTEDVNRNGIVDSGDLLSRRQSEKVRFYKIQDKEFLDIPESSEIEQHVDIAEIFGK